MKKYYHSLDEIVNCAKLECTSVFLCRTSEFTYYASCLGLRTRSFVNRYNLAESLRRRGLVELDSFTFAPLFG